MLSGTMLFHMNWAENAIVYQIYPRSFYDTNGDGVGELKGIIEKLPYIAELGANAIWLCPIYRSPMHDFGYDVTDHCDIDPIFGTLEDADEFIHEAHRLGMKVIFDFMPNHTSYEHPWFVESRSSRDNPKRDWYLWQDAKRGHDTPPNNWLSNFGGSGWEYDDTTDSFYFHTFLKEQPDLNLRNNDVRTELRHIMRFWLERGVDGFRCDAVKHIVKDQLLRSNPENPEYEEGVMDPFHQLLPVYSQSQPERFAIMKGFTEFLHHYPNTFLVTEDYDRIENLFPYYSAATNNNLAPLNLELVLLPWSAEEFKRNVEFQSRHNSPGQVSTFMIGNHDRPRVVSRFSLEQARLLALLGFSLPGMSMIYYGEELGMTNQHIPPDMIKDPFEKLVPGLDLGRDMVRTPMRWDSTPKAGFTTGDPWLPVGDDLETVNVAAQQGDPKSTYTLYRELIALRKDSEALISGSYVPFDTGSEHVLGFERRGDEARLLVLLNFAEKEMSVTVPALNAALVSSIDVKEPRAPHEDMYTLAAYEGVILELA